MNKKLLVIDTQATRNGATIHLLRFLRWLKGNGEWTFDIVFRQGGDLEEQFRELGSVSILYPDNTQWERRFQKVCRRLKIGKWIGMTPLQKIQKRLNEYLVIYCNSAANGNVLLNLNLTTQKVITTVHELDYSIKLIGKSFAYIKQYTDHYIAVANAVKNELIHYHGIDDKIIDIVHGFVDDETIKLSQLNTSERELILNELDIPLDANVVGSCGTADLHKGTDIFLHLARLIIGKNTDTSPTHFIWIGGFGDPRFEATLKYDLATSGLDRFVHFIGGQSNPYRYYGIFDVFVLPSRVDSFPLVILESALMGKPSVCFDQSGGGKEFIENDCGFVIPYLDIEQMAEKVIELLVDKSTRLLLGQNARAKVLARHQVAIAGPKILKLINSLAEKA